MRPAETGWAAARHVLAVRLDAMGDLLMTGPALRALREGHPERRVTLLTSPAGAHAARLLPGVDEVMVYEAPWMKATAPRASAAPDRAFLEALRARRFDAAVIFTVYSQNPLPAALTCYLADIPLRLAHCRENPYQLLTDWVPEREPECGIRHEVRRQLDLVASVGCTLADERMRLSLTCEDREAAMRALARTGVDPERPWAVLHPGASASSRRYAPERFGEAARMLAERGVTVLLTGGAQEQALVEQVRACSGLNLPTLLGLGLSEFAALLEQAPLLIANNSGPAHIAAAVGTPVVVLYALTNPQHTPWQVGGAVLNEAVSCAYCYKSVCPQGHHRCLERVPAARVAAAALEVLRARETVCSTF
ncbi:lipopolysaccharide heptosyltransferase II [Deinobacterium chartae]|uniref:Lipopolysaccharide heptosyltransferase II n=1 Tax=Deinobacterium chartae TaxID=521158 RepID=A0A841HX10_9DEIO|nr:glycosyltransferase family 9 protein [Deinobacterium chartae]MBB6097393.1 lipopolysaccharide heptosyltransferase II [Deinobacterium chartae]